MAEIQTGDRIPDFALQDQDGKTRTPRDFTGKPLVLFFYPKDGTPGCIVEACSFRDKYSKFLERDVHVVGISADDPESHARFANTYNLPYPLLADKDNVLRDQFGIPPALLGILPGRETFLFDENGILRYRFRAQFKPLHHVPEVLKALDQLQAEG